MLSLYPPSVPDVGLALERISARLDALERAPEAEQTLERPAPPRRAPQWLAWAAALAGAAFGGYSQVTQRAESEHAAAVDRLAERVLQTEARQAAAAAELVRVGWQIDRIAGDLAELRSSLVSQPPKKVRR